MVTPMDALAARYGGGKPFDASTIYTDALIDPALAAALVPLGVWLTKRGFVGRYRRTRNIIDHWLRRQARLGHLNEDKWGWLTVKAEPETAE